jgi:hypothetical protein
MPNAFGGSRQFLPGQRRSSDARPDRGGNGTRAGVPIHEHVPGSHRSETDVLKHVLIGAAA